MARPRAQLEQLADPVAAIVQQHQADGERDEQQVKLARPADGGGLGAALDHVHRRDGEALARALVAFAAGLRQVFGVDGRFRIRRRQDVVYAVAACAIGDGLAAGFRGQAVERGVEAHQAVAGHSELAGEAHVAMAVPAGVANVAGGHRRVGVLGC